MRFPDEPRARLATAVFSARRPGDTPRLAVHRHVQYMKAAVGALGVPVTFDIFGLTASATDDMGIAAVLGGLQLGGRRGPAHARPAYLSHYRAGSYGFAHPNGEPYRIVHRALTEALNRSRSSDAASVRPYLQAFTLGRRLPRYTPFEVRQEIRATEDLGINSWVLWNPCASVYARDALRPFTASAIVRVLGAPGD